MKIYKMFFSLCNLDCSLIFLNPILASVSSFHCDVKTLQKWIWTLHDDNECCQLMYNSVTMMSLLCDDNPALIGLLQISQHDCFKLLSWDKSEEGESKPTKITFNSSNNNMVTILSVYYYYKSKEEFDLKLYFCKLNPRKELCCWFWLIMLVWIWYYDLDTFYRLNEVADDWLEYCCQKKHLLSPNQFFGLEVSFYYYLH